MLLTKAIITSSNDLTKLIETKFNLIDKNTEKNFKIYEGKRKNVNEDSVDNLVLVLILENDFVSYINYLKENYQINKFINIGLSEIHTQDSDLKDNDVIIPNTFIHDEKEAIFVDYAIGENYDLKKFGLIMNGICETISKKAYISNISGDIYDYDSYLVLESLKNNDFLEQSVVIKSIYNGKDNLKTSLENSVSILDLII